MRLLELREANHIEFCRIRNLLDQILQMHRNSELNEILKLLMNPTWVATGLKTDFETLVGGKMLLYALSTCYDIDIDIVIAYVNK